MRRVVSRSGAVYRQLRLTRNVLVALAKRLPYVDPTASIHSSCHVARDLVAGAYVFLGRRCLVSPGVRIGRYTMLASEVAIVGDDHVWSDPKLPMQFAGRPAQRLTVIGQDVWLGHGVTVLRGLTVGDGAIVAAGSVVTHDVPPREVWAGVPARKIRSRFDDPADVTTHAAMLGGPTAPPTFAEKPAVLR